VCQTVSYAAVKSRKTAPVFRFCWNPFSIAAVKDIDIIISMISLIFWVRDIDISKGDINPPLVESSNTILSI